MNLELLLPYLDLVHLTGLLVGVLCSPDWLISAGEAGQVNAPFLVLTWTTLTSLLHTGDGLYHKSPQPSGLVGVVSGEVSPVLIKHSKKPVQPSDTLRSS